MKALIAALVCTGLLTGTAYAQNEGLVVVSIEDIEIIKNAFNDPNVNVTVPVSVQVPVGIAANVCDVNANVLAKQKKGDGTAACTAKNNSTAFNKAVTDQVATQ